MILFLHRVATRITQSYSAGGSGTAPLLWLVPGRNGWKSRLSQGGGWGAVPLHVVSSPTAG